MGLLKTGLKAAVAVKTADVIHERVLARQQQHAAAVGHQGPAAALGQSGTMPAAALAPPGPAAPMSASPDMGDKLAQLKQLGELRASGVLTDAEFEVQKAQILSA
ncbi:MAG: SHOCT domain-containing protein [Solirubrobacterales bacterium]|nr:SHOCT domain-containing protein [Solirubrobacterales bacterium]